MANEVVLVVDDDKDVLELLRYNVEQARFRALCAETGEQALEHARQQIPDLIVLDLMLPDVDGFAVCRALKSDPFTKSIPVIMLTAKGEETDVVSGLELGAVDYVVKPFSPKVLLARIRAALREEESMAESGTRIKLDTVVLDPQTREVWVEGWAVELTFTEFELLQYMMKNPGRVYTRGQLIEAVRGGDYPVTERSVDVQVVGLRKKLGSAGERIETVRGVGYRLRR